MRVRRRFDLIVCDARLAFGGNGFLRMLHTADPVGASRVLLLAHEGERGPSRGKPRRAPVLDQLLVQAHRCRRTPRDCAHGVGHPELAHSRPASPCGRRAQDGAPAARRDGCSSSMTIPRPRCFSLRCKAVSSRPRSRATSGRRSIRSRRALRISSSVALRCEPAEEHRSIGSSGTRTRSSNSASSSSHEQTRPGVDHERTRASGGRTSADTGRDRRARRALCVPIVLLSAFGPALATRTPRQALHHRPSRRGRAVPTPSSSASASTWLARRRRSMTNEACTPAVDNTHSVQP